MHWIIFVYNVLFLKFLMEDYVKFISFNHFVYKVLGLVQPITRLKRKKGTAQFWF